MHRIPTLAVLVLVAGWGAGCGGSGAAGVAAAQGAPPEDDAALRASREAVRAAQAAGDPAAEARALQGHAALLHGRTRTSEACDSLLAALDAAGRAKDRVLLRSVHDDLADRLQVLATTGRRPEEAIARYGQVVEVLRRLKEAEDASLALHSRATLAADQEKFSDAIPWFEEAVAERRKLERPVALAWSLNNLGWCLLKTRDLARAGPVVREAYEKARGAGVTGPAGKAIENGKQVALELAAAGKGEDAVALTRGLLEAARFGGTVAEQEAALEGHFRSLVAARRTEDALDLLSGWLAGERTLKNRNAEAAILQEKARLLIERKDFDGARAGIGESLAIHREIGDRLGEAWGLFLLARAAQAGGKPREALARGQEALSIFEACGRHRQGRVDCFQLLRDAARDAGDLDAALRWMKALEETLAEPPPAPLDPHQVRQGGPDRVAWYAAASEADVVLRLSRVGDLWHLSDAHDGFTVKVEHDWRARGVHFRGTIVLLAGDRVMVGRYALFLRPGDKAEVTKGGVLRGTRDSSAPATRPK
ncbi:MAG: tetratricopeptide repeat protein [Planctomycetales bacterium]|nr:tetratricopeptide repeat protein [Planctomycetales bacterium]